MYGPPDRQQSYGSKLGGNTNLVQTMTTLKRETTC
jgi:hypothetical protein